MQTKMSKIKECDVCLFIFIITCSEHCANGEMVGKLCLCVRYKWYSNYMTVCIILKSHWLIFHGIIIDGNGYLFPQKFYNVMKYSCSAFRNSFCTSNNSTKRKDISILLYKYQKIAYNRNTYRLFCHLHYCAKPALKNYIT